LASWSTRRGAGVDARRGVERNSVTTSGTEAGFRAGLFIYRNVTASTVRYNTITGTRIRAGDPVGQHGLQVYYNQIYGNGTAGPGAAVAVEDSADVALYHNVVYGQQSGGWGVRLSALGRAQVKNNVSPRRPCWCRWRRRAGGDRRRPQRVLRAGSAAFGWGAGTTTWAGWQAASGQDTHSQLADPRFVSTVPADFRLRADSPASMPAPPWPHRGRRGQPGRGWRARYRRLRNAATTERPASGGRNPDRPKHEPEIPRRILSGDAKGPNGARRVVHGPV